MDNAAQGIERFDRVPLPFGPSPVHRLERLERAPRRRGRDLGQARGLQLGPRLRRQQGAQARVPRRRRARAGLRHARLDRRRPVEPHAPGRGRRGAPRPRLRARAGALGRLGRRRSTRRSATSCSRGSWAPTCGSIRRGLRHRLPPELGGGARTTSSERGGKPYPIPAGASDHPLGGHGFARWADEVAEQEAELGVFFDTIVVCSVTGSTQAGMIAGFAGRSASATRARHRRLGDGRADVGPDRADRAAHRRGDRPRPRARATRRSSSSTSGTPARTASPTRRRSRRSASARGSRACSPTPSTRGSRWPR